MWKVSINMRFIRSFGKFDRFLGLLLVCVDELWGYGFVNCYEEVVFYISGMVFGKMVWCMKWYFESGGRNNRWVLIGWNLLLFNKLEF